MSENARLLVVDDEQVICEACRRIFSPLGFSVDTKCDAVEGLSLAVDQEYAAVLLDIKMPGLDGIRFLDQLRESKRDLPVILITGYPNIQNATSAVRLGAADYVTKPFAPEEIIQAVRQSLKRDDADEEGYSHYTSQIPEPWIPTGDELRFWNQSWLQSGEDGMVRVGAMLTRSEGEGLEAVRLPRIGETVYQGLPLAQVTTSTHSRIILPSPVSGVVVSVNSRIAECPSLLLNEAFEETWVACICPTRFGEEIDRCLPRCVGLVNTNVAAAREQSIKLASLGCSVTIVRTWKELARTVAEPSVSVLMVDAPSLRQSGPKCVQRVNAVAPSVRIVVLGSSKAELESAYRRHRILYYAVKPFADNEIVDILNAAFQSHGVRLAEPQRSSAAPKPVRNICITNGTGRKVRLLAASGLLEGSNHLGWQVTRNLQDRLYSVETGEGGCDAITPAVILDAALTCDRLLVLLAKDTGRLPGNLVRSSLGECASAACENAGNVTTMVVQPAPEGGRPLHFDACTTAALAEHIAREMTLCCQAA